MYLWFGFQSEFMNLCFCMNLLAGPLGLLDNIGLSFRGQYCIYGLIQGLVVAKQSIPGAGLAACKSLALSATARSD